MVLHSEYWRGCRVDNFGYKITINVVTLLRQLNCMVMSKEKEPKEKTTKKEPKMTLKEKRAAKMAKREEKSHA